MDFPNPPIPQGAVSSWLNRFHAASVSLKQGGSDTIAVSGGPSGMTLEVKDHVLATRNLVSFEGEYVEGNGYQLNTIVTVSVGKNFIDGDKKSYYSLPGWYICVSPVPVKIDPKTLTDPFLKQYYTNSTQQAGIVYAPIFIENDTRNFAIDTKDGKGMYWQLICPLTVSSLGCLNGSNVTTYVAQQTSGSA